MKLYNTDPPAISATLKDNQVYVNYSIGEGDNLPGVPMIGLTTKLSGTFYLNPGAINYSVKEIVESQLIPVGTIIMRPAGRAGITAPSTTQISTPAGSWIYCNGAGLLSSQYPELFYQLSGLYHDKEEVINPRTGKSDMKFYVPDFRKQFPQGYDYDFVDRSGHQVPSTQVDHERVFAGLPNIKGSMTATDDRQETLGQNPFGFSYMNCTGAFIKGDATTFIHAALQRISYHGNRLGFDASKGGSTIYGNSNTVQPPAILVDFFIKAKSMDKNYWTKQI